MFPPIDRSSTRNPYEQLIDQIFARVEEGQLLPGDQLPTVRALAMQLKVAPNTVARAYRELEHQGLLIGRGRAGTFVTDDDSARAARAEAHSFVKRMRALGVNNSQMVDMVRESQ